jgi:hypothetical protein
MSARPEWIGEAIIAKACLPALIAVEEESVGHPDELITRADSNDATG